MVTKERRLRLEKCSTHGEIRNTHINLLGKLVKKRRLWRIALKLILM